MKKELIDVVRKLRNLNKRQEDYLNKIPSDIRDAVFDNSYVNDLSMKNDILMSALFDEVVVEDIFWFLYEYREGSEGPHIKRPDGVEFTFNTDEDYYTYLKTVKIECKGAHCRIVYGPEPLVVPPL
jgi:hypothetical protein